MPIESSAAAKDFIRHLLVYNPAKRMTAEQALKHLWLQQARHAEESRPLDPEGACPTVLHSIQAYRKTCDAGALKITHPFYFHFYRQCLFHYAVLTSLRDFAKLSAFKRAALEAIAFSMSAQSISHLREQFSKLDKDSTGFVSMLEFINVLQKAGTSREEAASIFNTIDQDHTNHISYTEFLAATISRRLWLSRERIKDAFQRLDVEGTGFITRDNLKELLGDEWTAEKAETMMGEADAKGDGRIDFEEFLAVMTKDLLRGGPLEDAGGAASASAGSVGGPSVGLPSVSLASAGASGSAPQMFLIDATAGGGSGGGGSGSDPTSASASAGGSAGYVVGVGVPTATGNGLPFLGPIGAAGGGVGGSGVTSLLGGLSGGTLPTIPSVASSLNDHDNDHGSVGGPGKETQGRVANYTRASLASAQAGWSSHAASSSSAVSSPVRPQMVAGGGASAAVAGNGHDHGLHIRSPLVQIPPVNASSAAGGGGGGSGVGSSYATSSSAVAPPAGGVGYLPGSVSKRDRMDSSGGQREAGLGAHNRNSSAASLSAAGAFAPSPIKLGNSPMMSHVSGSSGSGGGRSFTAGGGEGSPSSSVGLAINSNSSSARAQVGDPVVGNGHSSTGPGRPASPPSVDHSDLMMRSESQSGQPLLRQQQEQLQQDEGTVTATGIRPAGGGSAAAAASPSHVSLSGV